jgi:hypothetical protein
MVIAPPLLTTSAAASGTTSARVPKSSVEPGVTGVPFLEVATMQVVGVLAGEHTSSAVVARADVDRTRR